MNQTAGNLIQQVLQQVDDSPIASLLANAITNQIDRQREELEALLEANEQGIITQEEFEIELQREKLIAEAELLSLQIAAKAEVQKAINKAFDVLLKSVAI